MKYIISEIQLRLLEQEEGALNRVEVILFKKLNQEKEKGKLKTKAQIKDYIQKLIPYLGLPENSWIYYTELFRANYRKDGKYEEISKSELIDPQDLPGKTISNTAADKYTSSKMPFKGSNLSGFWLIDRKGVKMYIVLSYGWYPIYIFKEGKWYEVVSRYSSSTGRQMSNASPIRYSENLDSEVYWATPDEMKQLMGGATHEEFIKNKVESFEKKAAEEISQRKRGMSTYTPDDGNWGQVKVMFKVKNLRREGDRGVVDIDVYGVKDLRNDSFIDYLNGERGITKEFVEKRLQGKVGRELRNYMGQMLHYYANNYQPVKHLIDFNFNHVSENKSNENPNNREATQLS